MIKLNKVSLYYFKPILNNIDAEFPNSGMILIEGGPEHEKLSLLNLIGGIIKPTSGEVLFDGENISCISEKELADYRKRRISFIYQNKDLLENLTARQNLDIVSPDFNNHNIIQKLNLENILDKKIKELSDEEKQKISIARALIKNSQIILAYEPFKFLSKTSKEEVITCLKEVSLNKLIIISTENSDILKNDDISIFNLKERKPLNIENTTLTKHITTSQKPNFNFNNYTKTNLLFDRRQFRKLNHVLFFLFLFIIINISLISIDYPKIHSKTLLTQKNNTMIIEKKVEENNSIIDEKDLKTLESKKLSSQPFKLGYKIYDDKKPISFNLATNDSFSPYFSNNVNSLTFYDEKNLKTVDYGRKPLRQNEIVISNYLADQIISRGFMENGKIYKPASYEQMVNNQKEIDLANHKVKIVGIYSLNLSKFETLKNKSDIYLNNLFTNFIKNEATDIYVKKEFFNMFLDLKNKLRNMCYVAPVKPNPTSNKNKVYLDGVEIFKDPIELIDGTIVEKLEPNEIIINYYFMNDKNINKMPSPNEYTDLYLLKNLELDKELKLRIRGISNSDNIYISEEALGDCVFKSISINRIKYDNLDKETVENAFKSISRYDNKEQFIIKTNFSDILYKLEFYTNGFSKIGIGLSFIFTIYVLYYLINYIRTDINQKRKDTCVLKILGVSNSQIITSYIYKILHLSLKPIIYSFITFLFIKLITFLVLSKLLTVKIDILPILIPIIFIVSLTLFLGCIVIFKVQSEIKKIKTEELFIIGDDGKLEKNF